MQKLRIGLISFFLPVVLILMVSSTQAAPLSAIAMNEGRTYDQAHDTGYIDWSGSAQYVVVTHRDGSSLPSQEGGALCTPSCTERVTRLGNGGTASGAFDRNVSYFEVMLEFNGDSNVGSATLRACSSINTWNLYNGSGNLPGFVSMVLTVPSSCRSWSLTASGGYVDFRSIDVAYIGPPSTTTPTPSLPPTLTPTVTFTPSLTPTLTLTSTMTFTPTTTYTNTPSPTPTPLPPQIIGSVVCDLWGDANWCRGNESLELTASDPQGFDVTITGDLNGEPFTCGDTCNLPLPEGIGTANYTAMSMSGQTASGLSTWQRDGTSPDVDISPPSPDGRNGWYVSEVDLSAAATDAISGLSSLAVSTDEGASWSSLPIHFTDGIHPALIHAKDIAGNEVIESRIIRVDTIPPVAQITSNSNGEVMQGDVQIKGILEDETSGPADGEITLDGGATWQAVSMETKTTWSYLWHSNEMPNGGYTLQMRGMDRAGNIGDVVSITLTVDNGPPAVSITERWWIWESGQLMVSPNHFPIATVQVTIRDPRNRWKAVVLEFDPGKDSYLVKWDRHFGDGTLAPSGEYPVMTVACDVNGMCAQDTGQIVIPAMGTSTTTLPPSPTVTGTPPTSSVTPISTPIVPSATPVLVMSIPEKTPEPSRPSFPFWQILGLLGLFMAIASASVVDPRPKALDRLGEMFRVMTAQANDDSFDANKINLQKRM